jgi:hypothetical protein
MKEQKPLPNIIICLVMDLIGYASFVVPGFGELSDLIWAPISGFVFYKMFGGRMGVFGGLLDFTEEILPFTDFIPTFTIAWFIRYRVMVKMGSNRLSGN